ITRHFEKLTTVFNRDQCAFGAVLDGELARFHESADAFDVALDADVAQDHQRGLNRDFSNRGEHGHNESDSAITRDAVLQEIDGLDVEIGCVEVVSNPQTDFIRLQVSKRSLYRVSRCALNSAGKFQFPGSRSASNFDSAQADATFTINAGCVHGAG